MEITFPAKPDKPEDLPPIKNAVTFVLSKDSRVFYYYGQLITKNTKPEDNKDGKPLTELTEITYAPKNGIVDLLMSYNQGANEKIKALEEERTKNNMADSIYKKKLSDINGVDKDAVTVLIKTDDKAKYKDVVKIIDQLKLLKLSKFVNVDITEAEMELVKAKIQ